MTTYRIITRANAKGIIKFWIEGRDDRSYATIESARIAARELGMAMQRAAVQPVLKRGTSGALSETERQDALQEYVFGPRPEFEIVVAA